LFTVLAALCAAVIIGANVPDFREGALELDTEVILLSMHETAQANTGVDPQDDADAYFKIPNFVFSHLSVALDTRDRMECQRLCNERDKCRSYSYRDPTSEEQEDALDSTAPRSQQAKAEKVNDAVKDPPKPKGTCIWSTEKLHYSTDWKFFTKVMDLDWQGKPHLTTENFHKFPGLAYQESSYPSEKGIELIACQDKCAKDPKCGAFSYNEKQLSCRPAGSGVHYDRKFSYYEKPGGVSASKEDLDLEAVELSSQEKSAKQAELVAYALKRKIRENKAQAASETRIAQESSREKDAKVKTLQDAEKGLLAIKAEENRVKDRLAVQSSFETGYFQARGSAQEKKTKEVELKRLELVNSEKRSERDSEAESGEYRIKKSKADVDRKITEQKLKISQTKEKLMKIKNRNMEDELQTQGQTYKNLALREKEAIIEIEKGHEKKVELLKSKVQATKEAAVKAKENLAREEIQVVEQQKNFDEEREKLKKSGAAKVNRVKAEYQGKIDAIILVGMGPKT